MIIADGRWIGPHGIGRFADEVIKRLADVRPLPHTLPLLHPLEPLWLSWVLRHERNAVYFTPGFNPPLVTRLPTVFTVHDLNHIQYEANSGAFKRSYYRWHIKPACRRASVVLTVSEFSRRQIIEWANVSEAKVIAVGNGISHAFREEGGRYDTSNPYFLYVGNRKPHKNLPGLIDGFCASRLAKDVRLVLTGDRDAVTAAYASKRGLEGRIAYAGTMSDTELAKLYRGAIGLIFPTFYEGFGLPVIEAMACGTPVIASDIPVLREVAGDAALFVDPNQPEAIADAMHEIMKPAVRANLRALGINRAKAFSWENTARRVNEALSYAR